MASAGSFNAKCVDPIIPIGPPDRIDILVFPR